jgi:hypothetical protein
MTEQTPAPDAARIMRRLAVPKLRPRGDFMFESAFPELAEPLIIVDAKTRLEATRAMLGTLGKGKPGLDGDVVDKMIEHAGTALAKLEAHGDKADLSMMEMAGVEAVIETDGSRPVAFVRHNKVDPDGPELAGDLSGPWREAARAAAAGIESIAASVGAVQLTDFGNRRMATAFVIAPGLVVTNRHVLEAIASFEDGSWTLTRNVAIDFDGEIDSTGSNQFKVISVATVGPNPINGKINFANLDFAVLKVEGPSERFPPPVRFGASLDPLRVGATQPSIFVMGFPAEPRIARGADGDGSPPIGSEYRDVIANLFGGTFGPKRWAPGFIDAGPGQLAGDPRGWVFAHDASTLGGNSGSCVADLRDGARVVGLHFGGRPRGENYAHAFAALQAELAVLPGLNWG